MIQNLKFQSDLVVLMRTYVWCFSFDTMTRFCIVDNIELTTRSFGVSLSVYPFEAVPSLWHRNHYRHAWSNTCEGQAQSSARQRQRD